MPMTRQGHLDQFYHVFAFLKKKNNSEMMFDPNDTDVGDYQFSKEEWNDTVYGECHEYLPPDALQCRGPGFNMRVLVDADHARDSVTRRSRTGLIIYLNSAPIYWTSNKHDRFETSSFASEFIAMKDC